jgi:hypothetical protein
MRVSTSPRQAGASSRPGDGLRVCGIACDDWCQAEARYERDWVTVHVYGWRPV